MKKNDNQKKGLKNELTKTQGCNRRCTLIDENDGRNKMRWTKRYIPVEIALVFWIYTGKNRGKNESKEKQHNDLGTRNPTSTLYTPKNDGRSQQLRHVDYERINSKATSPIVQCNTQNESQRTK